MKILVVFFYSFFLMMAEIRESTDEFVDKELMNYYVKNGFKTERLTANLTTFKDINEFWPVFLEDKENMYLYEPMSNWPSNKKETIEYLKKQLYLKDSFYFCIKKKINGKKVIVGQLNFKFYKEGILTLSYWIGKEHRRKGYLKEMGFSFIKELFFKSKRLKILEIYTDINNIPSNAFIKKLFDHLSIGHKCKIDTNRMDDEDSSINFYYLTKLD